MNEYKNVEANSLELFLIFDTILSIAITDKKYKINTPKAYPKNHFIYKIQKYDLDSSFDLYFEFGASDISEMVNFIHQYYIRPFSVILETVEFSNRKTLPLSDERNIKIQNDLIKSICQIIRKKKDAILKLAPQYGRGHLGIFASRNIWAPHAVSNLVLRCSRYLSPKFRI
eukprot:NODE_28_length_38599_cov_0.791792.p12 type:complete len:171 gc:universal NODE_28_length_38599_cov_0.791792:17166-17678(+)